MANKRYNLRYDPEPDAREIQHRQDVTTGKKAGTPSQQRQYFAEKLDDVMGKVRSGQIVIKSMPGTNHSALSTNRRLAARKRDILSINEEAGKNVGHAWRGDADGSGRGNSAIPGSGLSKPNSALARKVNKPSD